MPILGSVDASMTIMRVTNEAQKSTLTPYYTYIHAHIYWKFLNSHLFWLNSHPGHACLVLRACRSAVFLDHDAKKGCEFNQKRCEFKKFPIY